MGILSELETQFLRVNISRRELVLASTFLVVVLVMFSLLVMANLTPNISQHFTYLAQAFLKGKLYFLELPLPRWQDVVLFQGHAYWPLGPFPAVLLAPFVYLFSFSGTPFYQGYVGFWLTLSTIYFVYRLARLTGYRASDGWYLGLTFFSSAFFFYAWAPTSYYLAHVVVVALWFVALVEYLTKKRYWLLGLLCGLVLATRFPAGLGVIFFVLGALLDTSISIKLRWRRIVELAVPFLACITLLAFYNHFRFGSFFEQGYSYQILLIEALYRARDYGLLSFAHLPGNLYYLFLSFPQPVFRDGVSHVLKFPYIHPDPWGMSMFVTSPYLLYLFVCQRWDKFAKLLLVSCFVIATPILLYYGVGYWQFGYRYAFDFMPLLYFLFLRQYHLKYGDLTFRTKLLIVASAGINLYLFAAMYNTLSSYV